MTPFRKTQLRLIIEGQIRWLAPYTCVADHLREVVEEFARDRDLWNELETAKPSAAPPPETATTD